MLDLLPPFSCKFLFISTLVLFVLKILWLSINLTVR